MIINYRDPMPQQKELRRKVEIAMSKRGYSFAEFAKEMGIGHVTLYQFVKNERKIRYITMFKINEFLEKQPVK